MDVTIGGAGFAGIGLIALAGFVLWMAFIVGLVVLVALGIRWLIRSLNTPTGAGSARTAEDTALALLRERFARGEIDADEFEQRRQKLGT